MGGVTICTDIALHNNIGGSQNQMSEGTELLVKLSTPGILNCQINLAAILQLGPPEIEVVF